MRRRLTVWKKAPSLKFRLVFVILVVKYDGNVVDLFVFHAESTFSVEQFFSSFAAVYLDSPPLHDCLSPI